MGNNPQPPPTANNYIATEASLTEPPPKTVISTTAHEVPEESITVRDALKELWGKDTPRYKQTLLQLAMLAQKRMESKSVLTKKQFAKLRKKKKTAKASRKRNR